MKTGCWEKNSGGYLFQVSFKSGRSHLNYNPPLWCVKATLTEICLPNLPPEDWNTAYKRLTQQRAKLHTLLHVRPIEPSQVRQFKPVQLTSCHCGTFFCANDGVLLCLSSTERRQGLPPQAGRGRPSQWGVARTHS